MRILLWPFAQLYGFIILIRNLLFDVGILPERSYNFPVICIGNLKTGGTGKSPHVFYLAQLLNSYKKVTILSRGYGRSSKGFYFVNTTDSAALVGDESLQYAQQMPNLSVAVCEKRVQGIEQIISKKGVPEVLILDDAFQHRYVKAGLNILLTEYDDLYVSDALLPAGRLREPTSSAKRANCIIVTKCPASISDLEINKMNKQLNPNSNQSVFYSTIHYNELLTTQNGDGVLINELKDKNVLLLTGIANPKPLKSFLSNYCSSIEELKFSDHHAYSVADMVQLRKKFDMFAMSSQNNTTLIVTTRKDEMRLQKPELKMLIKDLPIAVMDIDINFVGNQSVEFNKLIKNYVESY